MKLLALIESLDHVCYRYRLEAFAWALAERGWMLEPVPLCRQMWRRIGQLASARQADAVILQRKLLPIWQLAILRRAAKCLVYDVDDAVFHRDSYHHKPPESTQRTARFWATVYAADATIARWRPTVSRCTRAAVRSRSRAAALSEPPDRSRSTARSNSVSSSRWGRKSVRRLSLAMKYSLSSALIAFLSAVNSTRAAALHGWMSFCW